MSIFRLLIVSITIITPLSCLSMKKEEITPTPKNSPQEKADITFKEIIQAAEIGKIEVIIKAIINKIDLSTQELDQALHIASENRHLEIYNLLLQMDRFAD